jgi:hypothetical protein
LLKTSLYSIEYITMNVLPDSWITYNIYWNFEKGFASHYIYSPKKETQHG